MLRVSGMSTAFCIPEGRRPRGNCPVSFPGVPDGTMDPSAPSFPFTETSSLHKSHAHPSVFLKASRYKPAPPSARLSLWREEGKVQWGIPRFLEYSPRALSPHYLWGQLDRGPRDVQINHREGEALLTASPVFCPVWDAVTKHPRLGGLNNRN